LLVLKQVAKPQSGERAFVVMPFQDLITTKEQSKQRANNTTQYCKNLGLTKSEIMDVANISSDPKLQRLDFCQLQTAREDALHIFGLALMQSMSKEGVVPAGAYPHHSWHYFLCNFAKQSKKH